MISTARMDLIPSDLGLALAELADRELFAERLGGHVPDNWPPESLADALPLFLEWMQARPDAVGWYGWYALARDVSTDAPVLVGSVGFRGPPVYGLVEIGYSVLPQFYRRGYATEMTNALVDWALSHAEVTRVEAQAEPANLASVRVLARVGFVPVGPGDEPGCVRFVYVAEECGG